MYCIRFDFKTLTNVFRERSASSSLNGLWRCLLVVRKPGFRPGNAGANPVSASIFDAE